MRLCLDLGQDPDFLGCLPGAPATWFSSGSRTFRPVALAGSCSQLPLPVFLFCPISNPPPPPRVTRASRICIRESQHSTCPPSSPLGGSQYPRPIIVTTPLLVTAIVLSNQNRCHQTVSEECNEFTYEFAEETRRQSFGAVTPGYDFMARLRSGMERILPSNAHELAHSRLHVSITNTKTRENYLVSSFRSREDLIKVLLASSFVPIYAGLKPVEYRGQVTVARNR
ncbi:patatin-like phospholipase domain-containing protein 4 isoform X4 [Mustela lutreola]|uniref:patatin-like phospholipase domain-containing protein 4 isoform X4 n=1 Tax=Mustela lutreola TaxID=9666 RepID=UPI002797996A|nr:patatin-like phospholipase domain-containing protein 4 isoform X4 [Mustela lutreola]